MRPERHEEDSPWRALLGGLLRSAIIATLVVLFGLVLFPMRAHAGRSCEARKLTPALIAQGMQLAERTAQALDASGARVVLLAPRRPGPRQVRPALVAPGHRLQDRGRPLARGAQAQPCGTRGGGALPPGPRRVLPRRPVALRGGLGRATPAVQAQLLAAMNEPPARIARLHVAPYSIVSYAWGHKLPAVEPVGDGNAGARRWSRAPSAPATRPRPGCSSRATSRRTLRLGPLTRLGGRVSAANVAFDDHPNEKRFSDRIETVTVDSVFAWLPRAGLGAAPVVLKL